MPNYDELDKRIAVLEVENDYAKEDRLELKKSFDQVYDLVYSIKEKLDRQNGIIPHISESIGILNEKHDTLSQTFNQYIVKNETKVEKNEIKLKVLWGIGTFLISGIVSLVIAYFAGK